MSRKFMFSGALASLGCATTFVFGFVLLLTQLLPYIGLQEDPQQAVSFVTAHHTVLSIWNFVIYILFGVLLCFVGLALHHRLSRHSPILSQFSLALGGVWVTLVIASGMLANVGLERVVQLATVNPDMAASLWLTVITIKEGLGGSNEVVGGLWVLILSVSFWRSRIYTRVLSIIGIAAGVAGTLSTVPLLEELGAIFGLLLIVWFVYLGRLMMVESGMLDDQQIAV